MTAEAIFLVEDRAANVYVIQRAVEEYDQDIQLWSMSDGAETLQFLRQAHPVTHEPTPALIILDLGLSKMNGAQIISEIRQLPTPHPTPISSGKETFPCPSRFISSGLQSSSVA